MTKIIRKGQFVKELLSGLGDFIVFFPQIFIRESMYYKDLRVGGHDPEKLHRAFRNLRHRGLITADKEELIFTSKGKSWLKNSHRRYFYFNQPAHDKKWRIIMFDIPMEHNKSRDKLRTKLKLWGFYMLQRSVFVSPFDCEREIAEICEKLGISDYIDIILTDSPGFREKEIKKFFNIS